MGRDSTTAFHFYNYKLDFFYIYILGNVLSLLVALALGLVGRIVAAYVKDLIGC